MFNIFNSTKFNRVLLSSTLVAFGINTIPAAAQQPINHAINLNDIAFMLRIEKIIERVNRYYGRSDQAKIIEAMIDLKGEIELYTGKKISLSGQLEKIENDIRCGGGNLKHGELKTYQRIVDRQKKRSNHKALYMAECLDNGIEYNQDLEAYNYICKSTKKDAKDKDEEDPAFDLPLRVTIGVTMALCGLFLAYLPFPPAKIWGADLMKAGVALAIEGTINRAENDKNKRAEK